MISLNELTLAELRDVCRQLGLPATFHKEQMRQDISSHYQRNRYANQLR